MRGYGDKIDRFRPWTRKDIAAILAPGIPYHARSPWHSSRAVHFGNGPNYALFANLPKEGKTHPRSDHIDSHGILSWTSGTLDKYTGIKGADLAAHNHTENEVLLFARSGRTGPYHYFGPLGNPFRVGESDKPFRINWQLLDATPGIDGPVQSGASGHKNILPHPPVAPTAGTEGTKGDERKEILRILREETGHSRPPENLPTMVLHESPWRGPVGNYRFAPKFIDEAKSGRMLLELSANDLDRAVETVAQNERNFLVKTGRSDLAERVITPKEGGYPVVYSSNPAFGPFPILVKATAGPDTTPFFLSISELDFMETAGPHARIYRIFNWNLSAPSADFFIIHVPFFVQGAPI